MSKKLLSGLMALLLIPTLLMIVNPLQSKAATARWDLSQDELNVAPSTINGYDVINLNGHKLVVNADLDTTARINLNKAGSEFHVKGKMKTTNKLDVQNGIAQIDGDYEQKGDHLSVSSNSGITVSGNMIISGTGYIYTGSSSSAIVVDGNLLYNSGANTKLYSASTMRVKGNIIQNVNSGTLNLAKVILTGNGQELSLKSNGTISDLTPGAGTLKTSEYFNVKVLNGDVTPVFSGGTLKIDNDIKLNGHKLTVNGNLDAKAIDLGTNGELKVKGNLNGGGSLSTGKGNVTIDGDWEHKLGTISLENSSRISVGGNFTVSGSGAINYYSSNATIDVAGDFKYASTGNCSGSSVGNIKVKGNVIQAAGSGSANFANLELTGNNQTITLQANGKIVSLKSGNGTLKTSQNFNVGKLMGNASPKCDGTLLVDNDIDLNGYTLTVDGDLSTKGIKFGNTSELVVKGNLENSGIVSTYTGAKMNISGNYSQKVGRLELQNSTRVTVGGNMSVSETGYISQNGSNSMMEVEGDYIYSSSASSTGYDSNIIVGGNLTQSDGAGKVNFDTVTMKKTGSKVTMTNGKIKTLILYHSKDKYTVTNNCYDDVKVICDIKLDANGGNMDAKTLVVKTGDKLGELPTPTRTGFAFQGWFTNNIVGDEVKADTVSTFMEDTTLWAHWKVQDNAQIRAFVNRLYQILLGREAEQDGLDDWTNRLAEGKANAAQIVEGIVNSAEFANQNLSYEDTVERMYQSMLNRNSDEAGKTDWVGRLNDGQSANAIINGFSGSAEFGVLCEYYGISAGSITLGEPRDQNPGISAFVARCYVKALGRDYEKDGMNNWCTVILDAGNKKEKAEEVAAHGFFHSQEFANKNTSNGEYVEILYRTFLGREYDEAGYNDWVSQLDGGKDRDEVLYGFSRSQEFSNIMDEYIK